MPHYEFYCEKCKKEVTLTLSIRVRSLPGYDTMGLRTGYSLLYRRQGIYRFRRFIPKDLREIIGKREIKVSLRTNDLDTAKRRLAVEALKTDRLFNEAGRILANPDARAFRAVQQDVEDRRKRPRTDDELDAESLALTDALEKVADRKPDPVHAKILRAVLDARQSDPDGIKATEDNPPPSILFDRWRAERQPPPKTWAEWNTSRKRFEAVIGGDLPVRSITKAHVRTFKESLLRTPKQHGNEAMLSPAPRPKDSRRSVRYWPGLWAQGYLDVNPADGIGTLERGVPSNGHGGCRHSFVDAARAVMIEEHRHAITGHSGGGVGRTYGTSVPLSVLAESMAKVRHPGVGHPRVIEVKRAVSE